MVYRTLFTFVLLIGLWACNSNGGTTDTPPPASQAAPANNSAGAPSTTQYPSISMEKMENLWNNTTTVDYIFYELPLSMNMTEKPAIQNTLRQISSQPAVMREGCKAMGRVFFQNQGETLAEADFYFNQACTYFLFYEDKKPAKSNQMTPEGITFFKQLLANAQQQQPQ